MSFILDALKKAESERSRQTGPVLMDVRIAAPRRRLPVWAWVLGGVLLANLLVLAWLLLRAPQKTAAAAPAPALAAPPTPAAPATAAPQTVAPPAYALPAPALPAAAIQGAPPAALPPLAAAAPSAAPASSPEPAVDVDNLPTYQDLLSSGVSLPTLALNLHVYDASPVNRYVLLNGIRLREGDFTPDGIKVERITPRGAVLDTRGRRFLLTAGG